MSDTVVILKSWYAGEVGGETLFRVQAERADLHAAHKWLALAQVEAVMATKLKAVMTAHGVQIPEMTGVRQRAEERCAAIAGKSWPQTMQWLRDIAAAALLRMRTDAARLPEELADIGQRVVEHEEALVAFAEWEMSGEETQSRQCIADFMSKSA